jgi:hypothetical protein
MTSVGVRSGVELEQVHDLRVGERTYDLDVIKASEAIDLSFALGDRLAVYVTGQMRTAIGASIDAILLRGGGNLLGGEGGLKLGVLQQENVLISLYAQGAYATGRALTLGPLIISLLDAPGTTLQAVIDGEAGEATAPIQEYGAEAGASAAFVLTPSFSIQASGLVRYARQNWELFSPEVGAIADVSRTDLAPTLGVALTLDAAPWGAPIAAVPEYRMDIVMSDNEITGYDDTDVEHTLGLGLYYSGRQDVQAGINGFARVGLTPVEITTTLADFESAAPTDWGGSFVLRVFW